MSKYIDADALIEKCGEWYTEEGPEEGYIGTLKQLLDKQPTIEPKQGEWIEVDDYFIRCKCSICGWESHKYEDDVYGMPYCPNCGARMKGTDDE